MDKRKTTLYSRGTLGKDSCEAGRIRKVRIALFVLAGIFVAAGIWNGSMEDMLIKAINICTECIGLG